MEVWPGEGCETAKFGILRERREMPDKGRGDMRLPCYQTRWRLHWFCKTQYAGEHGWEHFLKCHLRVIRLLDYWREMGARVKVSDEGGYWKSRSEKKLRRELGDYDRSSQAWADCLRMGAMRPADVCRSSRPYLAIRILNIWNMKDDRNSAPESRHNLRLARNEPERQTLLNAVTAADQQIDALAYELLI